MPDPLSILRLSSRKDQIINDTMKELFGIQLQQEGPEKAGAHLQKDDAAQQINADQLAMAQQEKQQRETADEKDLKKWTNLGAEQKEKAFQLMNYMAEKGRGRLTDMITVPLFNLHDTVKWNSPEEIKEGAKHVRSLISGLSQLLTSNSLKPNSELRDKALDLLYDLDPVLAKDKEQTLTRYTLSKNQQVAKADEKFGEIAPGFKVTNQHYRLLSDSTNKILSSGKDLQDLANMFFTRKTGILSGETRTYTNAKDALENFIAERNRVQGEIDGLSERLQNGEISEKEFKQQAKEKMDGSKLGEYKNKLTEKMRDYAVHASRGRNGVMGNKRVDQVSKSAGQARYAASISILDLVDRAFTEEKLDKYTELLKDSRNVRETTYQKIYLDKYKSLNEGTEEEKRIIAGRHAQDELRRRIKNKEINAPQMKKN